MVTLTFTERELSCMKYAVQERLKSIRGYFLNEEEQLRNIMSKIEETN